MIWYRIDSEVVICAPASRMRCRRINCQYMNAEGTVTKQVYLDGEADLVSVRTRDAVREYVYVDSSLQQVEGRLKHADMRLKKVRWR